MSRLIAEVFGLGRLRPAPGTWGSLGALPLAWLVAMVWGFWGLVVATFVVTAAGIWATAEQIKDSADKDPSRIVIDEVAGQWIALWPVVYGAAMMNVDLLRLWPGWITAFLLFRLFDIWKPGPVGWADRRGGAVGVMLDDIFAGILAGLGTIALAGLAHGVVLR